MTTIRAIAEAAGVSDTTVSRVLNSDGEYRRPTFARRAKRIREIATELGYRPNLSARAIRNGRFNAVTLVLSAEDTTRSSLPDRLLHAAAAALEERGMHLTIAVLPDAKLTSDGYLPRMLRDQGSDGLLINYNKDIPRGMVEMLEDHHLPAVWLNHKRDHDAVRPDDLAAAEDAVERLIALGHGRIVYVNQTYKHNYAHYSELDRRTGYERAMKRAGLQPVMIDRYHPGIQADGWAEHIEHMLAEQDRPTAVIAYGSGCLTCFRAGIDRMQLRVPQDISLISFGSSRILVGQRIDTMVVPDNEVGRLGIEMLLEKIDHPERPLPSEIVPFTFATGESLAPPPTNEQ